MTKRLMLLALMLGVIPLVVGCDEILKGDDKNKVEGKANAEKADPADAAKKAKKAPDFKDFSTADPLVGNAIQSRQQLVEQEDALLQRLDELRTLLASIKADPTRIRQSIEEFLALVKEIRRVVVKAGESLNDLDDTTRDLARSTKHLGNSYRAAAELFRLKARDYSEKKLRDQLNGFAEDFEAIGKSIPERSQTLKDFATTLPKLKVKVREANAFLDDVVIYLSSHPGIGNDPRKKYSEQFESFVLTFSELLRTLNEFRSTFREQAISKVIQDGHRADMLAKQNLEQAQRDELAKQERLKHEETERQANAKRDQEAKLHEEARREEARRQELAKQDEAKRQELAKRQDNERKEQAKKQDLERAKKNAPSFIVLQEGHPLWSPSGARPMGSPSSSMRGPIIHTPPPVEPKR